MRDNANSFSFSDALLYFLASKIKDENNKATQSDVVQEPSVISLAPRVLTKAEDIKTIQPYLNELKRSLGEGDLTNIAVTGAYGSGKSTIIKKVLFLFLFSRIILLLKTLRTLLRPLQ